MPTRKHTRTKEKERRILGVLIYGTYERRTVEEHSDSRDSSTDRLRRSRNSGIWMLAAQWIARAIFQAMFAIPFMVFYFIP